MPIPILCHRSDLILGSFVDSSPFKFHVGAAKRTFYVHSHLIDQCSDTLAALVGGGMIEATKGCANLHDIEEDTFIRFLEFTYTGDYSVPEPVILSNPGILLGVLAASAENHQEAVPLEDSLIPMTSVQEQTWGRSKDKKRQKVKIQSNWYDPYEEPLKESEPTTEKTGWVESYSKRKSFQQSFKAKAHVKEIPPWQPRNNKDHSEDYTPTFVCHAQLCLL